MSLALSTVVAQDDDLDAFGAAAQGRGLDGIEIVVDDAQDAAAVIARARATSARVVSLHAGRELPLGALARASGELGVPLSVSPEQAAMLSATSLTQLGRDFAEQKGRLLLGVHSDTAMASKLAAELRGAGNPASLGLAWELRPNDEDLRACGPILLATLDHLELVRLYGGGPEQRDQDGRGVGRLFVDLALAGYRGPIVLRPSGPEQLPRWREWLSSRKLAGCGSASGSRYDLDVRDVEPKDRLSTILGAFSAMPRGETLHITLDHDPSCMYYALDETQPAGSFAFEKVGDGPEVWSAVVKRLA